MEEKAAKEKLKHFMSTTVFMALSTMWCTITITLHQRSLPQLLNHTTKKKPKKKFQLEFSDQPAMDSIKFARLMIQNLRELKLEIG
jgi:hypothetical protein